MNSVKPFNTQARLLVLWKRLVRTEAPPSILSLPTPPVPVTSSLPSSHKPLLKPACAALFLMLPSSKVQFYRRVLPDTCISFSSEEGKRIFTESLLAGYANVYFPLAEQFRTQDEPAYCGLSTLVMALNTLEVDPKRVWKGPWRWYHEDMLDCCFPLELVQQKGITLDQFICLALCNYLDLNVVRMNEPYIEIQDFRKLVKDICSGSGKLIICSYSRKGLKQTGDGHFSPIGAYYPEGDLVLVMDVARYKYPPHWVKLTDLWEAMKYIDNVTGLPRGYIVMRKTEDMPLLLFRLSVTFRVTIATHDVDKSHMAVFLKSWRSFLNEERTCLEECGSLERVITCALKALNETLSCLLEGDSIFTTQFNTFCMSSVDSQQVLGAKQLLASLEGTQVYKIINEWVQDFKLNNYQQPTRTVADSTASLQICDQNHCCKLARVGRSVSTVKDEVGDQVGGSSVKGENDLGHIGDHSLPLSGDGLEDVFSSEEEVLMLTDSHYITMLLLCWPYQMEEGSSAFTKCLHKYIEEQLSSSDDVMVNEATQLRHQIQSLVAMVTSQEESV